MNFFKPEGKLIGTEKNQYYCESADNLREAISGKKIVEAKAIVCDVSHNLIVDLKCMRGIINREDGAIGIASGATKDIALITRVNKPVCFKVLGIGIDGSGGPQAILSRRAAQEECVEKYLDTLLAGDIIPARVTYLEKFGAFVDIGTGIPSLLPIDSISISRISHPTDRFTIGQDINVIVKSRDETGKFLLTHKELLGTWEENAKIFSVGETVSGIVRSIEEYGVFIELSPNLVGLAEPYGNIKINQRVTVFIKAIIPEKMKIKLLILDVSDPVPRPDPFKYFYDDSHIDSWYYSTPDCQKVIMTEFD